MQKLLANYLFQHQICVLPQIGTLQLKVDPAFVVLGTQKIHAPNKYILFTKDTVDSKNITEYIAVNKKISFEEAAYQLQNFSAEILKIAEVEKFTIVSVGDFYRSQNGQLSFKEEKLPEYFAAAIYAERVIHPDDSHSILVGDTETDRNKMTAYYTETEPLKKSKWWILATLLFILSIVLLFVYFNEENGNHFFGVSHKYEVKPATEQYKNIP